LKSNLIKWEHVALAGIVILALALRVWGIGFGLPYTYHIDEHSYIVGALNLGQGEIYGYPQQVGLVNVLFGEYALYYIIGRILGSFQSIQDFASSYHVDPTAFYLIGRITMALRSPLTGSFTVCPWRRLMCRSPFPSAHIPLLQLMVRGYLPILRNTIETTGSII